MLLSVLIPKCCLSKAKRLDFGVKENDVTSLEQACTKPVHILYVQVHQDNIPVSRSMDGKRALLSVARISNRKRFYYVFFKTYEIGTNINICYICIAMFTTA